MKPFDDLFLVVLEFKKMIDSNTDIIWSKYNSVDELIIEIENLLEGLREIDHSTIEKIRLMIAPTGSLQEISISNGWGEKFIELAIKVESSIGDQ